MGQICTKASCLPAFFFLSAWAQRLEKQADIIFSLPVIFFLPPLGKKAKDNGDRPLREKGRVLMYLWLVVGIQY